MRKASKPIASTLTLSALALSLGGVAGCHARSQPPVTASASLTSAQEQACRGSSFDADEAPAPCLHHGAGDTAPPADRLKVTLVSPPTVRSGYDAGLVVEMKNVSSEPLPLDVDDSCGTFEAVASNDKTTSFETDCFGMCAVGPEPHVLRVTLEPGGVVRKKVKFFAVETRVIMDPHDECVERTTGGLPPGNYDLRITLPWTDPVPEDPAVLRPRVLEAQLAVTP